MTHSRRDFLKSTATAALCATAAPVVSAATPSGQTIAQGVPITPGQIVSLFDDLPGDIAFKIMAPAQGAAPGFTAQLNSAKQLFAASAIKTYVLCEALRQADSPDIKTELEEREIALDSTVWSLGSPTFNPPDLSGMVSQRTALEAMIMRSDNTATDMVFKFAGVDNVRAFIAAAGLKNTLVPDSTRAYTGYLFGSQNYKNLTWEQLLELLPNPQVHPFLNPVQTLASSADDFVSYYSRALQGEFFQNEETLSEFRRVLTLCDYIYLVPLPIGASAYAKSGNADTSGFHARCFSGGMCFSGRWVYFSFIHNWYEQNAEDSATVAKLFTAINQSMTLVGAALSPAPVMPAEPATLPVLTGNIVSRTLP